jgi:hypothetical protein
MNASWKKSLPPAIAGALVVLALVVVARLQPARAAEGGAMGPFPRYSVSETEGHNLIVTDNQSNTLYFYTIDKDEKVGADLKLRGTIDLKQVGKPVIKPKTANGGS